MVAGFIFFVPTRHQKRFFGKRNGISSEFRLQAILAASRDGIVEWILIIARRRIRAYLEPIARQNRGKGPFAEQVRGHCDFTFGDKDSFVQVPASVVILAQIANTALFEASF